MLHGVIGTLFDAFTGTNTPGRHRRRADPHFHAAPLISS